MISVKQWGWVILAFAVALWGAVADGADSNASPATEWKQIFELIKTRQLEPFAQVDPQLFRAKLAPLLEKPDLKSDPEFLVFYGGTLALSTFAKRDLAPTKRDELFCEAYTNLRNAAEKGDPLAMSGVAQMLAQGLGLQRDVASALAWYQKAWKAIADKPYKRYHVTEFLLATAQLQIEAKDIAAAEATYKELLAYSEHSPKLTDALVALDNLALFYRNIGNYAAARTVFKRYMVICEKVLGSNHLLIAQNLDSLAQLYFLDNNYRAAEPLVLRALEITRKNLGPDHPNNAEIMNALIVLYEAEGEPNRAVELMERVLRIREKQCDQVFSVTSELEQTGFADNLRREYHACLSQVVEHLTTNSIARRITSDMVLFAKGAMLETLAQRQARVFRGTDPELNRLFTEWQTAREQLAKLLMATPSPDQLAGYQDMKLKLEARKEITEQRFARASGRFASQNRASHVLLPDVARALTNNSALVEFAKYRFFHPGTKEEKRWGDSQYAAFVLRGGGDIINPDVALIRLGSADKIEAAVKKWRKAAAPDEQGRRSDKAVLDAASRELATLVWNPIVPLLADCRKVYISPDGELAFVSFGALPGSKPDSFVIDDFDISYVATGRDLVRQGGGQANPPLLVGAPDFGEQQGATAKLATDTKPEDELLVMRSGISDLRSFTALSFAPLPSTRSEVENVARLLQQADTLRRSQTAATAPLVLTGAKADEATVKAAKHPSILHLATHGFFLPDSGLNEAMSGNDRFQSQLSGEMREAAAGKLWRQMKLKNPMHRSGIALAGANDTIRGRREAGGNDGILTAEEVAGMDLWGTKMVVISACESGLGEARGGEGVFGLRRAFTMAGAQSLVMTLWAVSDDATRQLMESLYRHLPEQRTPQRALLAAQREWIAKKRAAGLYPHPVHWAGFLASGIGLGLDDEKTP
ncbi:MAG: CHAT domain-containing protein [Verrucomicrobia bacterium]|nr:CHAT domain-containing protein [Verrucomicrobiota bacterium]